MEEEIILTGSDDTTRKYKNDIASIKNRLKHIKEGLKAKDGEVPDGVVNHYRSGFKTDGRIFNIVGNCISDYVDELLKPVEDYISEKI